MRVTDQKPYLRTFSAAPPTSSVRSAEQASEPDTKKLMDELKNTYKNINFDFVSFQDSEQLKSYAAGKTGLNNVAISPELLEKMANDETVRARVENVLAMLDSHRFMSGVSANLSGRKLTGMGLVLGADGEVSKWVKTEDIPKKEKEDPLATKKTYENTKHTNKKKKSYTIPYKYSQSTNMMRLAAAKSVPSVRSLIASKQNEIGEVRRKVSDPTEAAATIRKIKGVIRSGQIKIARLHKEEALQKQKKAAAKKMRRKLEQQLAEELRKKRTARKAQEHCQTASFDDIFFNADTAVNDCRYEQIAEQYAQAISGYAGAFGGVAAVSDVSPAASAAETPEIQISISSIAAIDCSA